MRRQDIYYIYRHIRLDTNTPFYVGKGCKDRAFQKKSRNKYWLHIAKTGYRVEIFIKNLTEEEAYKKEIEFIKLYKTFNFCEANFTTGGEGAWGYKADEATIKYRSVLYFGKGNPMYGKKKSHESKRKTAEKVRGFNNPMYGKVRTEETKKKISQTMKMRGHGCRPVICTNTGIIYQSASIAAQELGLHATSIIRVCRKKASHTKNLIFEYFIPN
jgi:group I intron endonuclease